MQNVVIDTNIVISAAITPFGNSAKIIDMVLDGKIQMYYYCGIMSEYIGVLSRPNLKIAGNLQSSFINGLKQVGICMEQKASSFPLPDESDRVFTTLLKIVAPCLLQAMPGIILMSRL